MKWKRKVVVLVWAEGNSSHNIHYTEENGGFCCFQANCGPNEERRWVVRKGPIPDDWNVAWEGDKKRISPEAVFMTLTAAKAFAESQSEPKKKRAE